MNFSDGKFARRLARLIAVGALLISAVMPVFAHRLDEYLQATLIALEKEGVSADMYLTPGVAVLPTVIAVIDTNADGVISPAERRTYAERVLGDLTITLNGERINPQLVTVEFPRLDDLKEGRGDIHLVFTLKLPKGSAGPVSNLKIENHHLSTFSSYQVNSLVPRDPALRVITEERNYEQSSYQMVFGEASHLPHPTTTR